MADFQSALKDLRDENVRIIAASSDELDVARKAVEELGIEYDLAYGADAETIARATGAFFEVYKEAKPVYNPKENVDKITGNHSEVERKFVQPTGFIIRPDKTIDIVVYSSGHIGRVTAKDVLTLVRYYNKEKKAA